MVNTARQLRELLMHNKFLLFTAVLFLTGTGSIWFAWTNTTLFHAVSCDQFLDTKLTNFDFSETQPGMESQWIDETYPWNNKSLARMSKQDTWSWRSLSKEYRLYTRQDHIILRQLWLYSTVTVDDMLRCLGEPDTYSIVVEPGDVYLYTLSFFYETQGYVAGVYYFYQEQPISVTNETPLFYIEIVEPDSSINMLKEVTALYDRKMQQLAIGALRQWPGNLRALEQQPTILWPEGITKP